MAMYNWSPSKYKNAMTKAKKDGVDTVNGWEWLNYLPTETRNYINFGLRGKDVEGSANEKRKNDLYQDFLNSGNQYIKAQGGLLKPFSYSRVPSVRY